MHIRMTILFHVLVVTLILFGMSSVNVFAAEIGPQLQVALLQAETGDKVKVIITLADKVDLKSFKKKHKLKGKKQKRRLLLKALKDKTDLSQRDLRKLLKKARIKKIKPLWMINAVAVTVPIELIDQLALLPGIDSIRLDSTLALPQTQVVDSAPAEWNLNTINADQLWAFGFTGQGIVVAGIGTGVDAEHQDLIGKYRGGNNSWYDPNDEHATPYDASGHGTQTMGLMVGGDAGGTSIGVAPGAQWIAAKVYNDAGIASYSAIHQGFQWLLDPDNNLDTDDAPDVVNGSWGFNVFLDQCFTEFQPDIQALKLAGIAVVFSAGNEGPDHGTSMSPANYSESTSVGAVDMNLSVASFSSSGPSACDSDIYPKLMAPGVFVKTTDLTFGGLFTDSYLYTSGTSFAAPHVAGSYALLKSAFPDVSLAELESALQQTAMDLMTTGPDNDSGYGLVDVTAAYNQLLDASGCSDVDGANCGSPPEDTVTILRTRYIPAHQQLRVWANSTASPRAVLTLAGYGAMPYVGNINSDYRFFAPGVMSNPGIASVSSDQGGADVQSVAYTAAPVAVGDAYTVDDGTTLNVTTSGVLANDSKGGYFAKTEGVVAQLVSGPTSGTLDLNQDGSFDYRHDGSVTASDSFTYVVNAINLNTQAVLASSPPVTVVLTINWDNAAPVATADIVNTTAGSGSLLIDLIANDYDPDGTIDAATTCIRLNNYPLSCAITKPRRTREGGSVVNYYNGTVLYTPPSGFVGTDIFHYRVKDNEGSDSDLSKTQINIAP